VVNGEEASGDLFAWWPVDIDKHGERGKLPPMPQMMAERDCRETTKDSELATCRYCLPDDFDWRSVADFFDEQGAWSLPDESELPRPGTIVTVAEGVEAELVTFTTDGVSLEVELVSDGSFRFYSYGNPDVRTEPEAMTADSILRFIQELAK